MEVGLAKAAAWCPVTAFWMLVHCCLISGLSASAECAFLSFGILMLELLTLFVVTTLLLLLLETATGEGRAGCEWTVEVYSVDDEDSILLSAAPLLSPAGLQRRGDYCLACCS